MRLKRRIILLLIVAAVLPLFAVFISLAVYANKQRESLVNMKLNSVYGGAVSLYERQGTAVLSQMKQLADDPGLLRYLLVKDRNGYIDQQGLIDFAVKMKNLLNLDYLTIVAPDGIVMARGHDPGLFGDRVSGDPVFVEALKGQKVQSLDKVSYAGSEFLISMGLAPVWYENREMIGVVAGGEYLDDEFCRNLQVLSGAEILLVEGNTLLAKTMPGKTDELLIYLQDMKTYRTKVEGLWYTFSRYPLQDFSGNKVADLLMGVSTHDLDILFGNMRLIYGGFAIGGLILAVIFGYLFAIGFTRPIYKLTWVADRLADGDFSARVNYNSRGELGNLIDTFNKMAADLENYRRKIVETERLSAFTMMARKVAHEIKNPLTPIRIAVEDLRRAFSKSDQRFAEDFDRSTNTVLQEVQSLAKIVEEFSEFAKFPPPEPAPDDLNEIVKATLSLYGKELDEGTLKADLSSKSIPVFADGNQIKRASVNLIKNALEAIPPGGRVTIRTFSSDRTATLIIADNGPGLSPQARENLFNPYFTTKPGGSGLGLVIVKKIVNEHDGRIRIGSSTEGGTAAVLELPLHKDRPRKSDK
jgi:nitrogen fixation/metabolism regulation signal transduction histidine kinase